MKNDCGCTKKIVDKIYIENSCCNKKLNDSNCLKNLSCKPCGKQIDLIDSDLYAENIYNYLGDSNFGSKQLIILESELLDSSNFLGRVPDPVVLEKVYNLLVETDNKTEVLIQLKNDRGYYGLKCIASILREDSKYTILYIKERYVEEEVALGKSDNIQKTFCLYTNDGITATYETIDGSYYNILDILNLLKNCSNTIKQWVIDNYYDKTWINLNLVTNEYLTDNYYNKTYINQNLGVIIKGDGDGSSVRKDSGSIAEGKHSFALSKGKANGKNSFAIQGSETTGENSIAFLESKVWGNNSIGLYKGVCSSDKSIAFGSECEVNADESVAIGWNNKIVKGSKTDSKNSFIFGKNSIIGKYQEASGEKYVTSKSSVIFGQDTYVTGINNFSFGPYNFIKNTNTSAIFGDDNHIGKGKSNVIMGRGCSVEGNYNIAMGCFSKIREDSSVENTYGSNSGHNGNVSIGYPFVLLNVFLKDTHQTNDEGSEYYALYYKNQNNNYVPIKYNTDLVQKYFLTSTVFLGDTTKKYLVTITFKNYGNLDNNDREYPGINEIKKDLNNNFIFTLNTSKNLSSMAVSESNDYYEAIIAMSSFSNISLGAGSSSIGIGNKSTGAGTTTVGMFNIGESGFTCGLFSKPAGSDKLFCIGNGSYNKENLTITRLNCLEINKDGIIYIKSKKSNDSYKLYNLTKLVEIILNNLTTLELLLIGYKEINSQEDNVNLLKENNNINNINSNMLGYTPYNYSGFILIDDSTVYDPYNIIPIHVDSDEEVEDGE